MPFVGRVGATASRRVVFSVIVIKEPRAVVNQKEISREVCG